MYPQPDWVTWTLNLPMATDRNPGDEWRYFTAGIVVLGDILNRVLPGGLEVYAHRKLFAKLGISNYEWQHTPQRVANTAGGLQLTPLDFAKFGELYRNGGRWHGAQVIPADWAAASMHPVVDTTVAGNSYAYLWWHKFYEFEGHRWPVTYCAGNGGNKIFVFDEHDLVVVITASAYGERYMHTQVDDMMTKFILPAIGH
jgi:CubicO group peptidase (beta-lactamase class C family)